MRIILLTAFALTACHGVESVSIPPLPPPPPRPYGGYHLPAPPPPGAVPYIGLTHAQLIVKLGIPTSGSTDENGGDLYYETATCRLWVVETRGIVTQVLGLTPDFRGFVDETECIKSIQ